MMRNKGNEQIWTDWCTVCLVEASQKRNSVISGLQLNSFRRLEDETALWSVPIVTRIDTIQPSILCL